jgi:hypothetical protein
MSWLTAAGRSHRALHKTRHQNIALETGQGNPAFVGSFRTRRPGLMSETPRYRGISSAVRFDTHLETDWLAGVRGLELGNVALRNAVPNSLVSQNNFVPETFRENCETADRRLGAGLGAATMLPRIVRLLRLQSFHAILDLPLLLRPKQCAGRGSRHPRPATLGDTGGRPSPGRRVAST